MLDIMEGKIFEIYYHTCEDSLKRKHIHKQK